MVDFINILVGGAALINFFLFALILLKTKKKFQNIVFASLILSITFWCISMFLYRESINPQDTVFYAKLLYAAASLIPTFFLIYSVFFNVNKDRNIGRFICFLTLTTFLLNLVLIFLCLSTDLIVKDVVFPLNTDILFNEKRIIWGDSYFLYLIYQNILFVVAFVFYINKYRKATGYYKAQVQYILLGAIFSIPPSFVSNLFLPTFGIFTLNWVGQLTTIIWDFFMTYAIINYRLVDVRIAIRRVIMIIINTVCMSLIGFVFYFINNYYLGKDSFNPTSVLIIVVALLFITIIFPSVNNFNESIVDKFLFKQLLDKNNVINKLSNLTNNELDLNVILTKLYDVLKDTFGLKSLDIIVEDKKDLNLATQKYINSLNDLDNRFSKSKVLEARNNTVDIIFVKSLEKDISSYLENLGIEIIIRLNHNKSNIASILLGEKTSQDSYTKDDLQLLTSIFQQISAAVVKAKYLAAEKNYTSILKSKVDEATAEIKAQKERIENQYQQERDMMGIIGHELRTPLTIARGNLEYLLKKLLSTDDFNDKEKYILKMRDAYDSIKKEAELVQTMLSTSHVDRNKIDLHPEPHNMIDLARQSVKDFASDAERKKLQLVFVEPHEKDPLVFADPLRMTEVTNNLVSNAVKYTDNGIITVFTTTDDKYLYVHVKDTGRGISEIDLKNIGKKFFRVENYLDDNQSLPRPGGTGLGVYVVKGILEASAGELLIESKLGFGSTFTAKVPKYFPKDTTQKAPVEEKEETDMFVKMGLTQNPQTPPQPAVAPA